MRKNVEGWMWVWFHNIPSTFNFEWNKLSRKTTQLKPFFFFRLEPSTIWNLAASLEIVWCESNSITRFYLFNNLKIWKFENVHKCWRSSLSMISQIFQHSFIFEWKKLSSKRHNSAHFFFFFESLGRFKI